MRVTELPLCAVLLAALQGCATGPRQEARYLARHSNEITAEEVRSAPAPLSAFELILVLRPDWMRGRGARIPNSPVQDGWHLRLAARRDTPIQVHVNGSRAGSVEVLRQIAASDVDAMRYLTGTEAYARFGSDHANGAVLVRLRRD